MNFRGIRLIILWGYVILSTSLLWGQKVPSCDETLEGVVYDRLTQEPLPYVNIRIEGTRRGTLSDPTGHFRFDSLCEREYDLIFSSLGYKPLTHHHDFHHPLVEVFLSADTLTLESVVVEAEARQANMASLTTSRLNKAELEAVSMESLGDVASQIAGVSTIRAGQNVVKPVIHGLHSNRVLIMNNGLRHEFQNWGEDHAPEIDPSLVDNLSVVKGAATVRYGPDALGGVLLINPPKMELKTPIRGEATVVGKSNGQSVDGSLQLQKGFKWLSAMVGGSYVRQGDLHAPGYLLTNTGKEELSYYGGLRLHPLPELDIEAYYSHFDQELGILRASSFGNLEDLQRAIESDTPLIVQPFSYDIGQPYQDIQHDLFKAQARYVTDKQAFYLQYGYQNNHRREFGVRRTDAPNINLILITESLEADWQHPRLGPISGKIGAQWQRQANDNQPGTNTVPFVPNYDSERLGVYWIESLDWGPNSLEFGLRFDHFYAFITGREPDNTIYRNAIVYNNASGTLGYTRKLNEQLSFRTNLGTAWRPPNVAELYRFGQHQFFIEYGLWRYTIDERFDIVSTSQGILTEEDREVPPEVGYKWIATLDWNKPNFRAELTGYVNYVQNFISAQPAGLTRTPRGFFVYFIYDQNDALFWGIDLSANWKHTPELSSDLKGSFLWVQQFNPRDYFAGQPPPRIDYRVSFTPSLKWFDATQIDFTASYTFEAFQHPRILTVDEFLFANRDGINRFTEDASDFDILAPPAGFLLLHAAWQGQIHRLKWQVQARNLLNTRYRLYTDRIRYFADDLGRNLVLSLTYQF